MPQPDSTRGRPALDESVAPVAADAFRMPRPDAPPPHIRDTRDIENTYSRSPRRYDLDWLRTAAVLMLIPYHAARLFDSYEPFYVKNGQASAALTPLRTVLDPWGMPLLFAIAGAGACFALQRRTGRQYLGERVLRLVLPSFFGLLVIVPPQAYYAWLSNGHQASYWLFFPQYWAFTTGEALGWSGGFTLGHLWFILWLFVISLLTLPLFLGLKRERGKHLIGWLARTVQKPRSLFVAVVLFWFTDLLPGPLVGNLNPFAYAFLFLAGFLFVADPRLQAALDRSWRWTLGLGVPTLLAWSAIRVSTIQLPEGSWQSTVRDFLFYFAVWNLVIGLLGFGHCRLCRPSRFLASLSSASYPYYILHQTFVVALGFYVLQLGVGVPVEYAFTVIAAGAATFGAYELIRRWNVTRALFGIRPGNPAA